MALTENPMKSHNAHKTKQYRCNFKIENIFTTSIWRSTLYTFLMDGKLFCSDSLNSPNLNEIKKKKIYYFSYYSSAVTICGIR